jgi:hypothetical protein
LNKRLGRGVCEIDRTDRVHLVALQIIGVGPHPHGPVQIVVGEDCVRTLEPSEELLALHINSEDVAHAIHLILTAGLILKHDIGYRRQFLSHRVEPQPRWIGRIIDL